MLLLMQVTGRLNRGKTAPGDVPLYADEATGKVYEAMPCIRHTGMSVRNMGQNSGAAVQ